MVTPVIVECPHVSLPDNVIVASKYLTVNMDVSTVRAVAFCDDLVLMATYDADSHVPLDVVIARRDLMFVCLGQQDGEPVLEQVISDVNRED